MNNKLKLLSLAVLLLLSTGSCKKEWLQPEPLSIYTPESYNTIEGLQAALTACERNLWYQYFGDGAPIITQEIFSDVAVEGTTDKSGPAQDLNLLITPDAQLNSTDFNRIGWYWIESYAGIKYANTVITYIDRPAWTDVQKPIRNALLGAAYFHRALRFYWLVNCFGDVPWIGHLLEVPRFDFVSTKREVILEKIKKDLEQAQQWVSDNVNKGQVTKGVIGHLLTKVNLELGKFDDAIASANSVINGGPYALMTTRFGKDAANATKNVIWDLHQWENKALAANKEALMLIINRPNQGAASFGGTQIMRQTVPFYSQNNAIKTPTGKVGIVESSTDPTFVNLTQIYGRGIGRCRPTWYSTNTIWENSGGDLRHAKGNWMNMEDLVYNNPALKTGDTNYLKPLQFRKSDGSLLCGDTIRSWFGWPHYKLYIADAINNPPRGGDGDWYLFRLAETYLLRAEAYFWKGNLASAAADINAVRRRAGAPDMLASEINIGTILDERARELYYEEPRKIELTRIAYILAATGVSAYNGKTYSLNNFSDVNFFYDRIMEKNNFYNKGVITNHGDRYTMSPYHVLFPVPQDAINANIYGVINQNKGYNGYSNNIPPKTEIKDDE